MQILRRFFPISLNTLILLLASVYSLSLIKNSDLIATIFAYSLIGLILIITILVVINYLILRSKLALRIIPAKKITPQYQNRPCNLKVEISNLKIFPLCQVKINVSFHDSNFNPTALILKTKEEQLIADYQIEFPHHAEWKIIKINYSISDLLGLITINGNKKNPSNPSFKIEPPKLTSPELQLVFSSLTVGDLINIPQKKMGDYYDLKRYHPSDGMGKIAWKIFARSQNLMSRHPEDTALPAGKSLVYLFGDRHTSALSRHCLNYLEQISQKDLQFSFACSGLLPTIYNDLEQASNLVLASVWSAKADDWSQNSKQLNLLLSTEHDCREIAIFMTENNPLRKQVASYCKTKGLKMLLVSSQKPPIKNSRLNIFLFGKSKQAAIHNSEKLLSQYV